MARKVFGKTVVIIVFKIRFMEVQLSGGKRISLEFLHQLSSLFDFIVLILV